LLLIFTLLSSLIGGVFGDVPNEVNEGAFVLFFLAISLSKLFSAALREAVEDPSFKMLFQPLDSNIKFDVQAKIDGVINQFALVACGGILLGVGLFHFMEPRHFSYLLVFILGAYGYVALKIYN
jgi:AAA family ATP:ADP antiporter